MLCAVCCVLVYLTLSLSFPAADYVGYLEDHHRKQTSKLEGMRKEVKALEIMKE